MKQTVKDTVLTREAVIECAKELGIPVEAITPGVMKQIKRGMKLSSATGDQAIKDGIFWAFKSADEY
jgi:hypothetical protein